MTVNQGYQEGERSTRDKQSLVPCLFTTPTQEISRVEWRSEQEQEEKVVVVVVVKKEDEK